MSHLSTMPNYAKRARKAVLAREKLVKTLGHESRRIVEEKQAEHGFRWAVRTTLTELGITEPKARKKAIELATDFKNTQLALNNLEQNKASFFAKKPSNPKYPNGYIEEVEKINTKATTNAINLVTLFNGSKNANTFLRRIFHHQKNLGTAWEKQEEFLKFERKLKRQ